MKKTPRTPSRRAAAHARASRLTAVIAAALALFCALPPGGARAAAGGLDPTFGVGGKVLTDFPEVNDFPADAALQPDGRLVVAGYTDGPSGADFVLARYDTGGALDGSFGAGGKVRTPFPGYPATAGDFSRATAVALQPDGKIVVAGTNPDFLLARYNPDGTLDEGFGAGGKVYSGPSSITGSPTDRIPYDVAVTPDGKIVAAGATYSLDSQGYGLVGFAMSRYNADGTRDESFGPGGRRDAGPFGRWSPAHPLAVIGPDGRVVFASYYLDADGYQHFVLARYGPDGAPDPSLGAGGSVSLNFPTFLSATALGVQPDGKVILAGSSLAGAGYDLVARRYDAGGAPDSTFGAGGVVTTDFGGPTDLAAAVAVQPDGRIIVSGSSYQGLNNSNDFAAVRYNADGTPDATLGAGGRVTADFGGYEYANAIAALPGGKFVLVGWDATTVPGGANGYLFALARFAGGSEEPPTSTPPTISCAAGVVAQTDAGGCSALAAPDAPAAADGSGQPLTPAGVRGDGLALGDPYPLGETVITWTATDAAGNSASCTQSVTVFDGTPPVISGAAATPPSLWPPDHRMVDVTVDYAAADCSPGGVTTALEVSSNEPADGAGDGRTATDWQVVDAHHVRLRAERAGVGAGRVYTITITATDAAGNASARSVTVSVPHDRR
ncbi:MAG TPA: HYR domain-containing protein [Pyrinomonadaceae bacterium]